METVAQQARLAYQSGTQVEGIMVILTFVTSLKTEDTSALTARVSRKHTHFCSPC